MHIVFNSNSNKRVLYFTFLLYIYIFTHCLIYHGMAHFLHLSFLFILYSNVKVLCYKSRIEFSSKGFFYSYFLFFFLFFKTVYEFTTNKKQEHSDYQNQKSRENLCLCMQILKHNCFRNK